MPDLRLPATSAKMQGFEISEVRYDRNPVVLLPSSPVFGKVFKVALTISLRNRRLGSPYRISISCKRTVITTATVSSRTVIVMRASPDGPDRE